MLLTILSFFLICPPKITFLGYPSRIFSSISEWKWYSVRSIITNLLHGHICLQPPPFLVYQAQHPYIYEGEGLISLQGGWQGLLFHGPGIKKYSDTICRGKTLAQCFIWLYRADTEIPSPWKYIWDSYGHMATLGIYITNLLRCCQFLPNHIWKIFPFIYLLNHMKLIHL